MTQENINKQRLCKEKQNSRLGIKEKTGQFSPRSDKQKNDRMKANGINSSEKLDGVLISTLSSCFFQEEHKGIV